jgi:hypothetical protein
MSVQSRRPHLALALDGKALLDLLRGDDGQVMGARLKTSDGAAHDVEAVCVAGTDGRFSPFPQKARTADHEAFPRSSTRHIATGSGVRPYDNDYPIRPKANDCPETASERV